MSKIIERFNKIKSNILTLKPIKPVNIVAISKTFSLGHIQPLIDYGHNHFGENKVQEAISKWSDFNKVGRQINLHMVVNYKAIKQKKL